MFEHVHLSTSCLHAQTDNRPELHEHRRRTVNLEGEEKVPGQCKWCTAMCTCPCHQQLSAGVTTPE